MKSSAVRTQQQPAPEGDSKHRKSLHRIALEQFAPDDLIQTVDGQRGKFVSRNWESDDPNEQGHRVTIKLLNGGTVMTFPADRIDARKKIAALRASGTQAKA